MPLENNATELKQHEKKKPKRIVYFSDGAVEEFSDDEEKPQTKSLPVVSYFFTRFEF